MTLAATLVLWAMLAQVALTFVAYFRLYRARAELVRRGEATLSTWLVPGEKSPEVARLSRNLSNQFELPVIFYAITAVLLALDAASLIDAILAWIFAVSRIIHAYVHTSSDDVTLRAKVFTLGFAAVALLALRIFVLSIMGW